MIIGCGGISSVGYKQVEARKEIKNGYSVMVLWLPSKGLRIGSPAPHGYTVAVVYSGIHFRCTDCGKICSPEVVRCLCEKK